MGYDSGEGCDFGVDAGRHHFPSMLVGDSRRCPGRDGHGKPVAGVSGAGDYRIFAS